MARGLPFVVCRSKSGGAHLYMFFKKPVSARMARSALKNWAAALGFPKAEVFPKQDEHVKGASIGNFINMPYFNSGNTNRHAFENGTPIGLQRFLELAEERECDADILEKRFDVPDEKASQTNTWREEIPEGMRHNELVKRGTYLRKQGYGMAAVGAAILHAAENLCKPPMDKDEVDKILTWIEKSVQAGDSKAYVHQDMVVMLKLILAFVLSSKFLQKKVALLAY